MKEQPAIMVSGFPHNMQGWYEEKLTMVMRALSRAKRVINSHPDTREERTRRDEQVEYELDTAIVYTETLLKMSCEKTTLFDGMNFEEATTPREEGENNESSYAQYPTEMV